MDHRQARQRGAHLEEQRRATEANNDEHPVEREFWRDMKFRALHVNIRGWISHAAELTARLRRLQDKPD